MFTSISIPLKRFKLQASEISTEWFFVILFVHFIMAYFYSGYSHADEHFQILEFAAYKIHHYPFQYPWELYLKLRSSLPIWGVIELHHLFSHTTPFTIALYTRFIAGTISAYAIFLFIQTFQVELRSTFLRSWFLLLSIFSYIALYQSVRYSSENLSGHLFLIGFCMLYRQHRPSFISGLFLGLSFIIRYQTGFLIVGFLSWLIFQRKIHFLKMTPVLLAIMMCIVFGTILDSLFYETFVSTAWQYLLSNIIQNKASAFGISRWTYLSVAYLLPYGPFYLFGILFFIVSQRKHSITWTVLPFALIHMMIPHKELRFLIPILSFMPFTWFYSLQKIEEKYHTCLSEKTWVLVLNQIGWTLNGLAVISLAILLHQQNQMYEFLWTYFRNQAYTLNFWTQNSSTYPDNSISSNMPYRYYLNSNVHTISFNHSKSFECFKTQACVVWIPCFNPIRQDKLLFDNCPKNYQFGNINHWKERANIYREKGRLYEIQD